MNYISWIINILMFAVSAVFFPVLPDVLPTHWNIRGEVDSYMVKEIGVWILPGLVLLLNLMYLVLPSFDPKKEKYKLFQKEWRIIQTGLVLFFAYLQAITFYLSINKEKSILPFMFIGLGALFVLIGNYLSKIRQNYFVGIKLPWTLASEDNWNKTHRFASWTFVLAGIVILIEAYLLWYAPAIVFGSLLIAIILPMIYSFLLYKRAEDKMRFVFIAMFAVLFIVALARLSSPEDDWICQNGQWIKHGNPSSSIPDKTCN